MDSDIFKACDIRGIVPDQIDADAVFRIGTGFAQCGILRTGASVVVGHDPRLSSEEPFGTLADGLTLCGVNVVDVGLCTPPMLYFAVNILDAAGGVMITASHSLE